MMQNTKKNRRITIYSLILLLAVMASVGVVLALMTKNVESRANSFSFSDADITLIEEKWDDEAETDSEGETVPRYIYPGAVRTKDPKVKNIGVNSLYVFLEVKTPVQVVRYVDEEDNQIKPGEQELLKYDINTSYWTELKNFEKKTDDGWLVRVYAYNIPLLPGKITEEPLFDSVTFSQDILEGQPGVGEDVDMPINAYAVQSENLPKNPELPDLEMAYNTYIAQENGNG